MLEFLLYDALCPARTSGLKQSGPGAAASMTLASPGNSSVVAHSTCER